MVDCCRPSGILWQYGGASPPWFLWPPRGHGFRMLSKLASYTLVGIDATPVEVEVDVSFSSAPKTVLVGLAEAAVRESTHRVERAIVNSGYRRPIDRVVINLAPADLKKDAGGFDLPIALGLLIGSGQV